MAKRVLLYVEDEDAAAFLLETALQEAHLEVELHRVADGEQALAFLAHSNGYKESPEPDLVLLDLNLPRKTGFEVLAEMQHADHLRKVPVVVFTSSALPKDRKRSLALGAREYITKPQTFDALVGVLKSTYLRMNDSRRSATI
ncbi:MAG TPA: response regulator [Bryobacteraceae bacterium]|nr:response regulator [Bryobacteraceae bacterium]